MLKARRFLLSLKKEVRNVYVVGKAADLPEIGGLQL
jgi:hypothetical protein